MAENKENTIKSKTVETTKTIEIKKNDFVEIKFTGKVKDGEIFDTNIAEDAKKIDLKLDSKPLIVCIGHDMLIKGFDNALAGKQVGKKHEIELEPKEAFQERKRELVRLMPLKLFTEKNINPRQGMTLALDNTLVKIVSVSGGRILVDFNNPLAGKIIIYDFTITRKVEDINEKVNAIIEFFLKGQKLDFEIKDKKIVFKAQEFYKPLVEELNKRFKDILSFEMVLESEKTEEKKEEIKTDTAKTTTPQQQSL